MSKSSGQKSPSDGSQNEAAEARKSSRWYALFMLISLAAIGFALWDSPLFNDLDPWVYIGGGFVFVLSLLLFIGARRLAKR